MKLAIASLIAIAAALAASAPASGAGAATERQCFRSHDIRNHTIGDDHTLYLDVGGREVWKVGMTGSCLAGAFSSDPIITRQPPGSAIVCSPIDLDISIKRSGGFATPCIVGSITRLTPAQVAALPRKQRP
jgi:hypothetical protein